MLPQPITTRIKPFALLTVVGSLCMACTQGSGSAIEIERHGGEYVADFAPGLASSEINLLHVASLGWDSSELDSESPDLDRKLRGGVFARIADIAESPAGTILVLDGEYHKVVEFDRAGTFKRVVLGGYGQGPGELIAPRSISVDSDGQIFVLDRSRLDVQVFSSAGKLIRAFHLPYTNPLQALVSNGYLYVRRFAQGDRPVVMIHDLLGTLIDSTAALDARNADFMVHGEGGRIAQDAAGLLYGLPTPGKWFRLANGVVQGRDLEPSVQPVLLRAGTRVSRALPVGLRGVASIGPDSTAILWDRKVYGGEATQISNLLAVLSSDGQTITTGRVPGGSVRFMVGSMIEPHTLFLARSEPFPHVEIVRIATGAQR